MFIFWSVFLGVVQGLTEFFPVSSSGHLAVFPYIFNFTDPGLAFDIALHAGTFFAILVALKDDWVGIVKSLVKRENSFYKSLPVFLVITSIPGAIFGYLLEEKAETVFRNPILIAITLIVFGFVLYWIDQKMTKRNPLEKMSVKDAIIIGLSQALALIPGVSRSGATITAGRALGFSREAAVRYSFLAALPIIMGATVFGLRDVELATLTSSAWIVGFLASFAASLWAIRFLTKYVQKNDFRIFFYYRIFLGLLIVALFILRG